MREVVRRFLPYATRAIATIVVLVAAVVIYQGLVATKPAVKRTATGAQSLRRVESMTLQPVEIARTWIGYGTARAMDQIDVPAEVAAIVVRLAPGLEAGVSVTQDQVLAELDDRDFRETEAVAAQSVASIDAQIRALEIQEDTLARQLELAEEETRIAERDYERVVDIVKQGSRNEAELDRQRGKLNVARRLETQIREQHQLIEPRKADLQARRTLEAARQSIAQRNIDRCTVRSPISGVIQSMAIEAGEQLQPGQRVARVVNLERIEVPVRFPSSSQQWIRVGDLVSLRSETSSRKAWDATVVRISPDSNPDSRTFTAYVELEQSADDAVAMLRPGQFLVGEARSRETATRLAVPRRAILGGRLLVLENGSVAHRAVVIDHYLKTTIPQLGVLDTEWAVLDEQYSATTPGEEVVLSNVEDLEPGMPVVSIDDGESIDAASGG